MFFLRAIVVLSPFGSTLVRRFGARRLLAGRFGFETAFFTGAAVAAVSLLLGAASMRGRAGDPERISAGAVPGPATRRGWPTGTFNRVPESVNIETIRAYPPPATDHTR